MRGREDRKKQGRGREGRSKLYLDGTDVLGAFDASSVLPWLSLFTGGGGEDKAKAIEAARKAAEEQAKREAAEAKKRATFYAVLGLVGVTVVGTGVYLAARR